MGGKDLLQPRPVHRHQLAGGDGHGGGDPGLPVEEGGLSDEFPGVGRVRMRSSPSGELMKHFTVPETI